MCRLEYGAGRDIFNKIVQMTEYMFQMKDTQ